MIICIRLLLRNSLETGEMVESFLLTMTMIKLIRRPSQKTSKKDFDYSSDWSKRPSTRLSFKEDKGYYAMRKKSEPRHLYFSAAQFMKSCNPNSANIHPILFHLKIYCRLICKIPLDISDFPLNI